MLQPAVECFAGLTGPAIAESLDALKAEFDSEAIVEVPSSLENCNRGRNIKNIRNTNKRMNIKSTVPSLRHSTDCSPLPHAVFVILLVLVCFVPLQPAQALNPPPDGAYPGANTAEGGRGVLFSLTTGTNNTALGSSALHSLTTGEQNTAAGPKRYLAALPASIQQPAFKRF